MPKETSSSFTAQLYMKCSSLTSRVEEQGWDKKSDQGESQWWVENQACPLNTLFEKLKVAYILIWLFWFRHNDYTKRAMSKCPALSSALIIRIRFGKDKEKIHLFHSFPNICHYILQTWALIGTLIHYWVLTATTFLESSLAIHSKGLKMYMPFNLIISFLESCLKIMWNKGKKTKP